jgi:hypothetical protein
MNRAGLKESDVKIRDLIERLEEHDQEAEVRFVYQEHWPLQDDIAGVWAASGEPACPTGEGHELQLHYEQGRVVEGERWCVDCQLVYEEDELQKPDGDNDGVVYVVSGGQHYAAPYGPKAAFVEVQS